MLFLSLIVTSLASRTLTTCGVEPPVLSKSLSTRSSVTSYFVAPSAAVKFATPCASTPCDCVMLPFAVMSRVLFASVWFTPSRMRAFLFRNSIPSAVAASLLTSLSIFEVGSVESESAVVTSPAVTANLSPFILPSEISFASARVICLDMPVSAATVPSKSLAALLTVISSVAVNDAFLVVILLEILMPFVTEMSISPAIVGFEGSVVKSPVRNSLPPADASKLPLRAMSTMESSLAVVPVGLPAHVVVAPSLFAVIVWPGLILKPRWRASI